jgi:hypothetical protein
MLLADRKKPFAAKSGRPVDLRGNLWKPQAVEIVGKQKHSFHADNLGIRPSRGHLSQTVSAATITEFRKWMSPPAAVIDYGAKSVRNSQYTAWVEVILGTPRGRIAKICSPPANRLPMLGLDV